MDNIIVTTNGGGIFSLYHQAIATILKQYENNINNISSFEIVIDSNHFLKNKKTFDDFFEYENDLVINKNQVKLNRDTDGFIHFTKVDCVYFDKLKLIVCKNKINDKIINIVNNFVNMFNINENTLTVHIRLTDMNTKHSNQYGVYTFDDYKNEIDKVLKNNSNINNIYVASDNNESIYKLISIYNEKIKIINFENPYRVEKENSDNFNYIVEHLNNMPELPVKVFTEMLIGSKGGYFIGRISDVSNFIILYSDSIKTIKYLN
jgi:hypothetical protein